MMFPKNPRQQNRALLDLARGQPCLIKSPICNYNCETTVACHGSGLANGKGTGYKVHDYLSVWGCSDCNHYTDAYKEASPTEKQQAWQAGHTRQMLEWHTIVDLKLGKPSEIKAAKWAVDKVREERKKMIATQAMNTTAIAIFNNKSKGSL